MKKLILTLLLEALIMAKSLAAEVFQQYINNNHKL